MGIGSEPHGCGLIEMAGMVVVEGAVVDLVCHVPYNKIHRRIDRDHGPHLELINGHMLEVARTHVGLWLVTLSLCYPLGSYAMHIFGQASTSTITRLQGVNDC